MKLSGPYVTLAGGLAVAGVLLSLSSTAVRKDQDVDVTAPVAAAASNDTPSGEAEADANAEEETGEEEAGDDAATPDVEPTPSGTYAGSVKGGGASIAISVKGGTAIAYVCDGTKVEAWMQGTAKTESLSLTGEDGASLKAKYTEGKLSGTIKSDGKRWTFQVKTVKAPSGLYRAARNVRSAKVVGGWIVYEGKQVGMLNSDGVETPAPPIDLTTRTVTIDGTQVQTTVVDGSPVDR